MSESTLNRVLFRSGRPWVEENGIAQDGPLPPINRRRPGPDATATDLDVWAGRYFSEQLDQTWELVFADDGLWIVPPGEAAQLLSPNGPEGLRSRGVNIWFATDAFLVSAVDEVTGDYIDGIWFERST